MSFDEFLNIANNAGKLLRAADVGLKDRIARLIYLNVRVDSEKVVDYQMREPFKTYFKTHKTSNGRGDRTWTCDLTAPSRTRYQLRHTPLIISLQLANYYTNILVVKKFFKHQKHHDDTLEKQTVILALQQDMGVLQNGQEIHAIHSDGTVEVLARGGDERLLWQEAYQALKHRSEPETPLSKDISSHPPATSLKVYTDGGSRGNPGPSASGYVIMDQDYHVLEEGGQYLGVTTNNQAEYQAVKIALEAVRKFKPKQLDFYIDSQLVVNQLNGLYRVKNLELKPIHESIQLMVKEHETVTFHHVYREFNRLADKQVNIILDKQQA